MADDIVINAVNDDCGAAVAAKGKKKVRKPQTEEEYNAQKLQFLRGGPTINTEEWLYDDDKLDRLEPNKKVDFNYLLHSCEKAYFQRDYLKCLELVQIAEQRMDKGSKNYLSIDHIKQKCLEKL